MKNIVPKIINHKVVFIWFLFSSIAGTAQIETIPSGSFIINMGNTNTLTINDDVKPYGMIYDLMKNYNVPIKWVITQGKAKDAVDFVHNGISYKGGTFIVPADYRSTAVNNRITYWQGQGVVGATSVSSFQAYVYKTLVSVPRWTLDAANGSIAQAYLTAAGITLTAFPGAYNWKAPQTLDCCDDFFVMPHADPKWSTHSRLFSWNIDCLGSIWAACHAVSALENSINPSNSSQQMNFLSTRTAAVTPTPWPNNSLKLWGTHSSGSVPYTHRLFDDPVAQYMGVTDLSQLNGSEQIYIPKQTADAGGATRWRPGAKIIAYDPTQVNVPSPDVANGNAAAVIVYGRGFDDPTRGFVMYEAGHSHMKGTSSDGPALRAFLNFSFFQVQPKAPQLGNIGGLTTGQNINQSSPVSLSITASSPLSGITFSYQWTSSVAGGSFSDSTSSSTTYTPPSVVSNTPATITCIVTDNCGRKSFQSVPVTIVPPPRPPVTIADAGNIDPGCGSTTLIKNVLSNDSDPDGDPIQLTLVNGNAGSFTTVNGGLVNFNAAGNITYTNAEGFYGTETLTYTVCDNTTPQCASGTYVITVGNPANIPPATDDAFTIAEDAIGTFNVLANDLPVTNGPYTVYAITSGPTNGKVSVNTDNTITYIPNPDFSGTDQIRYRIVNALGYSQSALITVTVTNDACDGGTYQTVAGSTGSVNLNPTNDTYLREDQTDRNYGSCATGILIDRETNKNLRGLLKFDLASIPSGATITNATLNLVATAAKNNTAFDISAHRMTTDWVEGTLCDATNTLASNGPTWDNRNFTTIWGSTGGDFNASAEATTSVSTTGNYSWTLTSLVQNWKSSTFSNYGVLLKFVTEDNGGNEVKTFGSKENATAGNRPVLSVNYSIPPTCASIPARAPLGNQDTATTLSTTPITFNVVNNDYLFSAAATALTISTVPIAAQGSATANLATGEVTFTPNPTFNGVATFQYTVTTANGTDVIRVYVTVNNAPLNANDDNPAGQNSGTVQTISVLSNDVDPEGAALSVTIITQPVNGTATVNGSNQVIYTPNAGFTGTDVLTYQVCEPSAACGSANCDTATVNLIVLNRAPVGATDSKTILPCLANTIDLLSNDTDPEGHTLSILSLSALSDPAAGTLINNNDGTVTFTPTPGYSGTVTFTYTLIDNGVSPMTSATPVLVTIVVFNPPNTAPVAINDAEVINMEQTLFAAVRDNDSDPENQNLTIPVITINPLHGSATVNPLNGLIEYIPNPGFSGTDVLTYQICDEVINQATCSTVPGLCATATLTITVDAPNTVNAINDENSTWVNTDVSGATLINDFDPQGDLPLVFGGFLIGGTTYTSGSHTISGLDETGTPVVNAGTLTINADGTYTFSPANNFTGSINVPYVINDSNPNTATDTAALRITINPLPTVTNSIIANNDEISTLPNTSVSSTLFTNDRDPQANAFTVTAFQYDSNGDGTPDGTGTVGSPITVGGITTNGTAVANAGTITINADGSYSFIPATDFSGTVEIPYTITDALGANSTALLHIDVLADINGSANDKPQPGDDFVYTDFDTPVSSGFINNDIDPNADPVSVNGVTINTGGPATAIGGPLTTVQGGTVQFYANGTYTYTPPPGYTGPDRIVYQACDITAVNPQPLCANATIHMLVAPSISTLPVTGLSVSVNLDGNSAIVNWKTETEYNTSHFIVERSIDNINYSAVGITTAAGNSNTRRNYSFTDNVAALLQNEVIFYRIRQVDTDGSFKLSKVVIIRIKKATAIRVWPNPFTSSVSISIVTEQSATLLFRLTDISGRSLVNKQHKVSLGFSQITVDNLDNLVNGIYLLEITNMSSNKRDIFKLEKINR